MNDTNSIEEVMFFHKTYGHPIGDAPSIPNKDRVKLRLSLILEELSELADALGNREQLEKLMKSKLAEYENEKYEYREKKDIVEVLDALLDIRYVVDGTVIECGLHKIHDKGFDEVQDSNMSKVCTTEEDAILSVEKIYNEKGVKAHWLKKGDYYVICRTDDNKTLKGIDFKEPDLKKFFNDKDYEKIMV